MKYVVYNSSLALIMMMMLRLLFIVNDVYYI